MAFTPQPGEQFTIRRKVLKLFGAAFHIYDGNNTIVGFCKQKAFKLREDIRIYTNESMTTELVTMKARAIIDWSSTYDVTMPGGIVMGSLRRKGGTSTFIRDEWMIFDATGAQVGTVIENSGFLAIARRYIDYVSIIAPQSFKMARTDGSVVANLRQHFNPFVYRMGVSVSKDLKVDEPLDEMLVLAAACLIAAIEGRQG